VDYVRWFEELGREAVPIAGRKGANLAEMARAGLPVPPGFSVCMDAFDMFVQQAAAGVPDRYVVEKSTLRILEHAPRARSDPAPLTTRASAHEPFGAAAAFAQRVGRA
jgi:phosphoenolpyruvate synthase/pyruvate phosphate dikinase